MSRAVIVIAATFALFAAATAGAAGVTRTGAAASTSFVKPVDGAVVSQGFGCTDVPVEPVDDDCPGGHWHSGIDLAAATGTTVVAAAAGHAHVIVSATGFGLHVVIDHGAGLQTLYGHLSAVTTADRDEVAAGQPIGAVGSTGNSTGPHLHFEVDRNGVAEDPRGLVPLP
ncbi:MAG: M23 family metallopeptidase [Candidatus Dormibacteria bacterium]